MNKKILVINAAMVLTIAGLLAAIFNAWLHPPYPTHVEIASLAGASKKFEPPPPIRENYPPTTQESVTQQNLFRKERAEYVPPAPPESQGSRAPVLPPPKLKVSGIMLLNEHKKIAVLEGTYSSLKGPSTVEDKNLKKKGYPLGDQIGSYQISEINKTTVSLDNKEGSVVSVSLALRSPEDRIQRTGNHFFHKGKKSAPPPPAAEPEQQPEPEPPAAEPEPQASAEPTSEEPAPAPKRPVRVKSEFERISGSDTEQPATEEEPPPPPNRRHRISGG